MLVQFPKIFSHKSSKTSQSTVDATATTQTRSSTTITMLEEEFGACQPPKSGLHVLFKLKIPKLKNNDKPTTQGPDPCLSPSISKESRVILWDWQGDEVNLSQSPVQDVGYPTRSFPDHHANAEQDSELDQDVVTPTKGTPWSSDEELTPLCSSNFPRTPHTNALRDKDGDLIGIPRSQIRHLPY